MSIYFFFTFQTPPTCCISPWVWTLSVWSSVSSSCCPTVLSRSGSAKSTGKQSTRSSHNPSALLSPEAWVVETIAQSVMNSLSCKISWRFYLKSDDQIRSQFCTCHDSSTVVTCASLWPDWISGIIIKAKRVSTMFYYDLIYPLWTGALCPKAMSSENLKFTDANCVCTDVDVTYFGYPRFSHTYASIAPLSMRVKILLQNEYCRLSYWKGPIDATFGVQFN